MKMINKKVLAGVEKVIRIRVETEANRWPPLCKGALHQPKRPKNIKTNGSCSEQLPKR